MLETEKKVIEALLDGMPEREMKKEFCRFLVRDDTPGSEDCINVWAIRDDVRELYESTIDLEGFEEFDIRVTFARPKFFTDVVRGSADVTFWQVSMITRILRDCKPIFDIDGFLEGLIEQVRDIKWSSDLIELKRSTTKQLLERAERLIEEDMIGDALIWTIKAAEEAICVPMMEQNKFNIATAVMLLDALREGEPDLHAFFLDLLNISTFSPKDVSLALEELERLGTHLYYANERTRREMWILSAFVSINESERRLKQCYKAQKSGVDSLEIQRLFEASVAELWQAIFLIAQTPGKTVMLDPWAVGWFWKWFMKERVSESLIQKFINRVEEIAK